MYQMARVDAIAHEYEFGESDHPASSRSQLSGCFIRWNVVIRAFAEGKRRDAELFLDGDRM